MVSGVWCVGCRVLMVVWVVWVVVEDGGWWVVGGGLWVVGGVVWCGWRERERTFGQGLRGEEKVGTGACVVSCGGKLPSCRGLVTGL